MKRFSRIPSIEILEEKRLKAADLAAYGLAHGPAFVDPPEATSNTATVSEPLLASHLEQSPATLTSAVAEESSDESGTDEQQTETNKTDSSETEMDTSDDNETDGSTDTETDGSDDTESGDDTTDNETDDTDDSDTDDTDEENEMELTADLTATTGNQGSGTAESESETENSTTKTDLKIEVSGLATDGTYNVMIGDTTLTPTLTVTNGEGKLKLSTDPDSDEQTLPPDLVTDGATIKIILGGQTILQGDLGPESDSGSTDLQSISSASKSDVLQSAPISLVPSTSIQAQPTRPLVSQLMASSVTTGNADNSADANLLDTDFGATSQSMDSWKLTDFQPNLMSDQNDAAALPIDAALLEFLADGDYVWMA
jgi:hypothetical protein